MIMAKSCCGRKQISPFLAFEMKGVTVVIAVLLIVLAGQSEGIWISRVMPQKFWKVCYFLKFFSNSMYLICFSLRKS